MAVISSNNRVVVHNKGNNNNVAYLKRYSAKMAYTTWSTINYKKSTVCGHCNGACYCNKNSTIYVTGYAGNKHTNRIVAFDSKTLELVLVVLPMIGILVSFMLEKVNHYMFFLMKPFNLEGLGQEKNIKNITPLMVVIIIKI